MKLPAGSFVIGVSRVGALGHVPFTQRQLAEQLIQQQQRGMPVNRQCGHFHFRPSLFQRLIATVWV